MKPILKGLLTAILIAIVLCPLAYIERGYLAAGGEVAAALAGGIVIAVRQHEKTRKAAPEGNGNSEIKSIITEN